MFYGRKFCFLFICAAFCHLQPNPDLTTCLITSAVYMTDYIWGVLFVFLSHIVITYQWVCSSAGKGSPFFNSCWSVFPVWPSFFTEHETSASFQTALEMSLFLQTVNDHSLKTCHWLLLEVHSQTFLFVVKSAGGGESQRSRAALFGRTQTRRRLPCLSERQWSVHFYLTRWQASTRLSPTFHFRVYEPTGMQEWTHGCEEQESENATTFSFHKFTEVL